MKQRLPALLLALLAVLGACTSSRTNGDAQPLQLYFTSALEHGPSIVGQPYRGNEQPSAETLISALLAGPTDSNLRSPFPAGLALRSCTLEDGLLTVDFSEQYGGLANLSLTLADYCLVLTVCQLEDVDRVEILVGGQPLSHRSHQTLTQEEVLLALEEGQ